MVQLQEHKQWEINGSPVEYDKRYNNLRLIQWSKPMDSRQWGYYASYKIGAEWIDVDKNEAIVVTAKMEDIDFLRMFMTCFSSDLALDSFSNIYNIDIERPAIFAPVLNSIISPLIVIHFLAVVNRIKKLKRGYVHYEQNLKKIKGHVKLMKNERINIATKRYDRIFCEFDEYSEDIPENRLIKKAIVSSKALIAKLGEENSSVSSIQQLIAKNMVKFVNVKEDVHPKEVKQIHSHKLFSEYAEAIRLAKLILKQFDYSLHKTSETQSAVTPFVLDMSLLYEHYVYGLLYEAYDDSITYQFKGNTGIIDFLYKSKDYKAILDTKYNVIYQSDDFNINEIRQLSGYSRDSDILEKFGYDKNSKVDVVIPCVIIYPKEGTEGKFNPFKDEKIHKLCESIKGLYEFYKIGIPLPTIQYNPI